MKSLEYCVYLGFALLQIPISLIWLAKHLYLVHLAVCMLDVTDFTAALHIDLGYRIRTSDAIDCLANGVSALRVL